MKILALDTATEIGGLALLEEGSLTAQSQIRVQKTHTHGLWKNIFFLLEQADWRIREIDLWAVTVGPGSFTGLRIGLSTVKGLALATGKPVVGISTLEVLASSFPFCPTLICPMLDARKKEVFYSFYRSDPLGILHPSGEPRNERPNRIIPEINEPLLLVGSGALLYQELFRKALGSRVFFPASPFHIPSPLVLGNLALERYKNGEIIPPDRLAPLYIRPSDAELKAPLLTA